MSDPKPKADAELKALRAYKEAEEDVRTEQAALAKAIEAYKACTRGDKVALANARTDVEIERACLDEAQAKQHSAALELARAVMANREATLERAVVLDDLLHIGGRCTCHGEGACPYCKRMLQGEALYDALEAAIKGLGNPECACLGNIIPGGPCIHERVWSVSRAWEALERHHAAEVVPLDVRA